MIDKILLERKLRKIEEFLKEIKSAEIGDFEEFKNNIIIKRFVERNLELAIEQMIDICKHLVSGLDLKEPETYAECFNIISDNNIISAKNSKNFESMARFRNLIIHSYDYVDDSVVYGIFKNHIKDFDIFAKEIRRYIKE